MKHRPPTPQPPPPQGGRGSVVKPALAQSDELLPVATEGLRGVGFGAVILAAGLSSRMVENKLLLPWTDGEPIVRHVLKAYVEARVDPIIVVTGRDAELVAARLRDFPLSCAHNPDYATGEMLSSLKAGLRALPEGLGAVFIQPGDMPCITSAVIRGLAAAHEPGWNIAPVFEGQRGHPVLLDRAYWRAMLDLSEGARPRDVLEGARDRLRLVDVDERGVVLDVDTRAAYERGLGR